MNKEIHFEELPNDQSWLWREAKLKDPDNNQLILYFADLTHRGKSNDDEIFSFLR